MKPVIQLERTGCGIAAVAVIAGVSYEQARSVARTLGISAKDRQLWSDTRYVRRLLARFGCCAESSVQPFRTWDALPSLALLAIKWHREGGRSFWHWVVFVQERDRRYVLDSKEALTDHVRRDFWRMKPKWYITVDGKGKR